MTALYSAFGMTIASEIPLIELPAGRGTPDVIVSTGSLPASVPEPEGWSIHPSLGEVSGWAPAAGAFRVTGGRDIVVDPVPDVDARALRMAIVGPLLGVVLAQRGAFVLHASTVVIDGRAVAFAGPSGRGKSTLSGALTRAGHLLVAEDMTVIDTAGAWPVVQPGFPRLKLWPDAATMLDHDVETLPLLHPQREKRSLALDAFHPDPIRLARCYLLEDGDEEAIAIPPATEGLLALIRCTYQAPWLSELGSERANLVHCGALIRSGVVRRLERRRRFDALREVASFIERDVGDVRYEP